ncbi:uncharacterized protein LOC141910311 [Tubulanus polymorphus]|uniref:uncharacterized protein LOC141910311 n=1 Tax=Tubulanus polymorphus TaxID=672921 RepID=UPI003DA6203C
MAEAWTEQRELDLIVFWEAYPCLYDHTSPEYSKREARVAALDSISTAIGIPVNKIKTRMTSLRTQYTKTQNAPPSGSRRKTPSKKDVWVADKMQFLKPFITVRGTLSSLDDSRNQEMDVADREMNDNSDDGDVDDVADETDFTHPNTPATSTRGVEATV